MKTKSTKGNILIPIGLFLAMIVISFIRDGQSISMGPGISVEEAPQQTQTSAESFKHEEYNISPMAEFECSAKIISKKYYSDHWADISPIDMTLGWEKLSDESIIHRINFDQTTRWTHYTPLNIAGVISAEELRTQHGNFHMCPANDDVRSALLNMPQGSVIHFKGKLINLSKSGWSNQSSLKRTDSGAGACEIVWVEEIINKS